MMKIRMLVVAALLGTAVIMGACNDDLNQGNQGENKPDGEGYFSFGLSNLPKTRVAQKETEEGETEERQVAYIWVLLYGADDGKLKYAYELDATNIDADDPDNSTNFYGVDISHSSSDDNFVTVGYKVAIQDYKVVVIINPIYFSNYLTGFTMSRGEEGSGINESDIFYSLSTLMDVNNGDNDYGYFDYGDPDIGVYIHNTSSYGSVIYGDGKTKSSGRLFMMTNANGVIEVSASDLRDSKELAESTPSASIKTDRIFAKVMVNENTGSTPIVTRGTLHELTYGIQNRNKFVYPIRLFANTYDSNGSGSNYRGEMETVESKRENIYATDPNFDTKTSDFESTADADYIPWNHYDAIGHLIDETGWFYVPENTMALSVQQGSDWAKYTTQVHIKAIIFYSFSEPDADNSYYSWYNDDSTEWKVFSHKQALKWMTDGFPSEMTPLKELIGYTNDSHIFVPGSSSFFSVGGVSSNPPIRDGNERLTMDVGKTLTFHYKGYNEYTVPIKHFPGDDNLTAEQKRTQVYGHYGVVRNNIYRVTINSIKGPGTPLNGWIATDITINGWYNREQIEDL